MGDDLFESGACDAVVVGTCVMLVDDVIVYAGPIKNAPDTAGKVVLLNSVDFEKLRAMVHKRRH